MFSKFQVAVFLMVFVALFVGCNSEQKVETETAKAVPTKHYEFYGDSIATDGALSTTELFTNTATLPDKDSLQTKITGEIIESCGNKGCWVSIKAPNNESLTLRFKDYGFFVPTSGLEGKTLIADGVSRWEVTSVEDLKAEAKEEGKSAKEIAEITEPKKYLTFTASGVAITD
jgi:hypothetical protein